MRENGGDVHINDGLTWWQRPIVSQAMRDKVVEVAKEVVDTTKTAWQEFIGRFTAGRKGHERDDSEHER